MKNYYTYILFIALFVVFFTACKEQPKKEELKPEKVVKEPSEWISLFDGKTTKGWRAYNGDSLPPGWIAKNGELTYDTKLGLEQDYKGGKDIIYGDEEFENFELYLEWKLPKGGNSGIFYHVKEGYDAPYVASPEYQLIDDENYASIHDLTAYNKSLGYTDKPEELKPLQKTASDYAMHPASEDKILHPVGEWNSTRIIFTPEKVEHWLNGKMVLSFKPWTAEWFKKKNSDKWKNSPDYGKFKKGYIGLQDHASPIWFRNIKIRKL